MTGRIDFAIGLVAMALLTAIAAAPLIVIFMEWLQ